MSAAAAGTMQWAWTSMVLTRLPLTTTSRRRACGVEPGGGAAGDTAQGMKARAARVVVIRSAAMGISISSFIHCSAIVADGRKLLKLMACVTDWEGGLAPGVGLEPTTQRLTAACSTN